MESTDEIMNGLVLELRRGTFVLSVLSQLQEQQYGYSLVQSLERQGFAVDPGTLYPLLRRLEKQELLTSAWETSGAKPRKYYRISESGQEIYRRLCREWENLAACMDRMVRKDHEALS